ncbi:MAG: hypothetical protein HMLKMBBP_03947 [Planctomycetes bacterium]|nr:hypothetical protein [Planctomycetota bacterium]
MSRPVLDLVREKGAYALFPGASDPATGDAARTRAALDRAAAHPERAADAYSDAATTCTLEALDEVLAGFRGWRLIGRRGRHLAAARTALRTAPTAPAVRLAAAVVGELGEREDVADLETLAAHPELTLHCATALANLRSQDGRAALLRLLHRTAGAERIVVIDRLLAFVTLPAVRLALVRDALAGLDESSAREIAPAIAEACDVRSAAGDPSAGAEVRAGARRILELCSAADSGA